MPYTVTNYKTKKSVREAIKEGKKIECYQPNDMYGKGTPLDGTIYLKGPHYPKPHRWYGQGVMKEGYLVSIK